VPAQIHTRTLSDDAIAAREVRGFPSSMRRVVVVTPRGRDVRPLAALSRQAARRPPLVRADTPSQPRTVDA